MLQTSFAAALLVAAALSSNGWAHEMTAITFTVGVLASGTAWWTTRTHELTLNWLDAALVLFGAWLLLALWVSEVVSVSTSALLGFSTLFTGYFVTRRGALSPQGTRTVVLAIGGVTMLGAAVFLWLHLAAGWNIGSPFIYRHMFTMTVLAGVLLGVAGLAAMPHRPAVLTLAAAAAFVVFVLIALGGSRGVLLAATGALFTVAVLAPRTQWRIGTAFMAGGGLGYWAAQLLSSGYMAARVATLADPLAAGSPRFLLWESVLPLIAAKPWLGHGPGMLYLVWPPYRAPQEWTMGSYAHQSFLDFAVTIGIPGAMLLALLFLLGGHAAWQATRVQPWQAWVAAAGVALLIHANLDFTLFIHSLSLSLGLGLGLVAASAPSLPNAPAQVLRRWLPLATTVVVAGLLVFGATSVAGYAHQRQGEAAFAEGRYADAFQSFTGAIRWWPSADMPRTQRAHVITVSVLEADDAAHNPMAPNAYAMALQDTEAAVRLNPYRASGHITMARVLLAGHELGLTADGRARSVAALGRGLARNPRNFQARMDYAQMLDEDGDPGHALAVLMDGFDIRALHSGLRPEYHAQIRDLAERLGADEVLERLPEP